MDRPQAYRVSKRTGCRNVAQTFLACRHQTRRHFVQYREAPVNSETSAVTQKKKRRKLPCAVLVYVEVVLEVVTKTDTERSRVAQNCCVVSGIASRRQKLLEVVLIKEVP